MGWDISLTPQTTRAPLAVLRMSACAVEVLKVDCAIVGLLESQIRWNLLEEKMYEGKQFQRYEGTLCKCSLSVLLSVPFRFVMVTVAIRQ